MEQWEEALTWVWSRREEEESERGAECWRKMERRPNSRPWSPNQKLWDVGGWHPQRLNCRAHFYIHSWPQSQIMSFPIAKFEQYLK